MDNGCNDIRCFSDSYENTNFISRFLFKAFFDKIASTIPVEAKKVLEVGCGPGFSLANISERIKFEEIEASDVDDGLISLARRKNPTVKISQESVYDLKRSSSSFDLVLILEVLEHLDNPEKALEEIERVTSKYVVLSVPNEPLWRFLNMARGAFWKNWGNTPGHINHWNRSSFSALVLKYFDIVKVETSIPWIIVLAKKRNKI